MSARDHPRSRGEYESCRPEPDAPKGSSPLSRGILERGRPAAHDERIIPALAGNTILFDEFIIEKGDHPRSRGEYGVGENLNLMGNGSSPLSRGIHGASTAHTESRGIIPALAGNTWTGPLTLFVFRDHPRSRGEYTLGLVLLWTGPGSSPLSRGIRCGVRDDYAPRRIIPALAGNTCRRRSAARSCTDHPRSRGEYWNEDSLLRECQGSSPLSRGIRHRRPGMTDDRGIIPALAGNTSR